jgi:lysophospholipase L1-like esterase
MTKNILCFGDSNTFGINPATGKRFDESVRWPALLQVLLGPLFSIIEAGEPNRTLVNHAPFDGSHSGLRYLKPYLNTLTLDTIVVFLGTNDLKHRYDLTPEQITQGLSDLITCIHAFYQCDLTLNRPKIIIIGPLYVSPVGRYKRIYSGSQDKLLTLESLFSTLSENKKCDFLKLENTLSLSNLDGIHLDEAGHLQLSKLIGYIIKYYLK